MSQETQGWPLPKFQHFVRSLHPLLLQASALTSMLIAAVSHQPLVHIHRAKREYTICLQGKLILSERNGGESRAKQFVGCVRTLAIIDEAAHRVIMEMEKRANEVMVHAASAFQEHTTGGRVQLRSASRSSLHPKTTAKSAQGPHSVVLLAPLACLAPYISILDRTSCVFLQGCTAVPRAGWQHIVPLRACAARLAG